MISLIVCSVSPAVLEQLRGNVAATIGIPYELIAMDNREGKMGICEAYNRGAAQAQYDCLCFMHEDIAFETPNWGMKMLAHLQDPNLGLIGLAGGDTKGLVPSSWSSGTLQSEIHLIQHYKRQNRPPERIDKTGYPNDPSVLKPVVCIDGVLMCTRRDVFAKTGFDQHTFPGFHGYDLDFSLQIFTAGYKVGVISDIAVHHFSEGSFNRQWLENVINISEKWKKRLPLSVRNLSHRDFVVQHWTAMGHFLQHLSDMGYSRSRQLQYFARYGFTRFFKFDYAVHFFRKMLQRPGRKDYGVTAGT